MLKIDRSFVNDMLRPESSLAEAIVQIAHTLGLVPIAEGVENQAQADALAALGCDLAQGFHLGRPSDAVAAPHSPSAPPPRRSHSFRRRRCDDRAVNGLARAESPGAPQPKA